MYYRGAETGMDLQKGSEQVPLTAAPPSSEFAVETPPSLANRVDTWSVVLGSLGLYVCSRFVGLLAAFASTWIGPTHRLTTTLTSWDGFWYLKIASGGYPGNVASEGAGNRWAFFPGYPVAIRFVERLTPLSYRDSAIVVSLICGALAAVAIGLLMLEVFSRTTALRTVALIVFFPTAFVMSMAYTESLFLTFAAVALIAIQRRWWTLAAVATTLASLTRSVGIVLAAAIAVEAARRHVSWRQRAWILGAAAVSSLGFVAWCLYGRARTGHLLAFQTAEKAWGGGGFAWFQNPFQSVKRLLTTTAAWHIASDVTAGIAVLIVIGGIASLVMLRLRKRSLPWAWLVYTAGGTLTAFSPYWTTSTLRYIMVLLPLFGAFAALARRYVYDAVLASFALFQGVLALVVFVGAFSGHAATAP